MGVEKRAQLTAGEAKLKAVSEEDPVGSRLTKMEELIEEQNQEIDRKFSEMLEAIRSNRFEKVLDDPIAELKQLKETNGIVEYHKKFELLSTRVNLTEDYLVRVFLDGLQIDTQVNVQMFQPQTIRQCFLIGKFYEYAHPRSNEVAKDTKVVEIEVPVSNLESSLQFHNASPVVCEDSNSVVVGCDELFNHQDTILQASYTTKARDVLLKKSTSVPNSQVAHQLFEKMPLREQSKKRHIKCFKCWRFKFKLRKQRRGKPRIAHELIDRGGVMYKYFASSVKVAVIKKKNKFCKTWYPYENLETGSFLKTDSISELELESPESNMETNSVAQPQVSIFVLESSHQQKLLGVFDMNTVNKDQQYVLAEALSPLFDNFRSEVAAFCEQSTCVKSHQRKQRLSLKSWMFKYKLGKEWKKRRNILFLCVIVMRALHVDRLQKRKMPLLLKYNCRTVLAEEYNTRCLSEPRIKHKSEQLLSITISVSGFNRASQYQVYLWLFLDKTLASQFQLWYGGEETRYCYKLLLQQFLRVTSTTRQREQFSSAQVRSKLKGNSFKYGRMHGAKGLAEGSGLQIILRRIPHLKQPKTWSFKYKQQKHYHDVLVKEPGSIS